MPPSHRPSSSSSRPRRWRLPPNLAGALALALVLAVAYHDVIFLGRTFQTAASEGVASILGDMPWGYPGPRIKNDDVPVQDPASSAYNEEVAPYAINATLRQGALPHWNPWVACGTPLAAHPITSVYYPLAWITHLWPGAWSWDAFLLLRLWVAGLFTFLFLRERRLAWGAALAGGVFFMLSGYLTRYINLFHLNVECLVPAAFWAMERLRRRPSRGRFAVLVAVLLMAILGGNPQSLIMLALCLGAWGAFTWAQRRWRSGWGAHAARAAAGLGIVVGAFALAALLGAFFLLPFFEFYFLSVHPHAESAGTDFLAIFQSITLYSQDFYFPVYLRYLNFPVMPMGAGVTFLCVFCVSRLRRRRAEALFFLAGIILIYCKVTGFWFINWIGRLPLLHLMPFTKYSSELYFFIAVAAALGLHNLLRRSAHPNWTRLGFVLFLAAPLALYERNLYKFLDPYNQAPIRIEFLYLVLKIAVLAAMALAALWMTRRGRRRGPLIAASAIGLWAAVEIVMLMNGTRALRYDVMTPPPGIEQLRRERLAAAPWQRVYGAKFTLFPQSAAALGMQDLRDFSPLIESRYWTFMNTFLKVKAIPSYLHPFFETMFTGSTYQEVVFASQFDMLGARYVISDSYINTPKFHQFLLEEDVGRFWGAEGAEVKSGFRRDYFYITMDSTSYLDFDTTIPATGDTLLLDPVIDDQEFWRMKDGVIYRVFVEDAEGERHKIFEHLENPHSSLEDRVLQTREISLDRWAGQSVTLTFQVDGDIGNRRSVKCLWRNLYLRSWEEREQSKFTLIYDGEVKIYENSQAFPRAWVAGGGLLTSQSGDAIQIMQRQRFDPRTEVVLEYEGGDDPRVRALLDGGDFRLLDNPSDSLRRFMLWPASLAVPPMDGRSLAAAATLPTPPAPGKAEIAEYGANRVTVRAELARPGFLVLSDTYYPGWRASVNGRDVPIIRANTFLRAVPLPAGNHEVEFRYAPRTFYAGVGIALVTLLGWSAVMMRPRRQPCPARAAAAAASADASPAPNLSPAP